MPSRNIFSIESKVGLNVSKLLIEVTFIITFDSHGSGICLLGYMS